MKIIQWIIVPLMVVFLAAIAATLILYQLIALTPSALPMNAQARPASYTEWLFGGFNSRGVVNGDFGNLLSGGRPASELVRERLSASLELFVPTIWQSLLFGIPLGILLALLRRWLTDGFLRPFMWLGISTPTFWLAMMLILIFAVQRGEFPTNGRCNVSGGECADLQHLILPLRTLVIHWTCIIALAIRTALLPLLQKDPKSGFRARYWLDGVLNPVLVLLPAFMAGVVSTQVLVESVFAWPGVGRLIVQATMTRDLSVVIVSIVMVVLSLIAIYFALTVVNGLIGMLFGTPNPTVKKPQPQADMLVAEPVGAFDESQTESTLLRPFIDKIYTALAVVAALIFLGIGLVSLQPSFVTHADPLQMSPADRLQPPGAEGHPYGTDELGRDFQARLLAAGQNTLRVGFVGALIALVVGTVIGFVGGLFLDSIGVLLNIPINAVIIGLNLLPTLPLILLIVGIIPIAQVNMSLVLGLVVWGNVALTIRAKVAAGIRGEKQSMISWLLVLVYGLTFNMAVIIGIESSASFLGIGVQPPDASWGSLLATSMMQMANADYLVVLPGLLITVTVLCLHIIASRIQDSAGFFPAPKTEAN
jgi:ABC-type dipeptide/oligopeptide/nickel transport system permease component/ABC-type antimicrobial peptide transport system permease subunit